MRVVGGQARGIPLKTAPSRGLRPTTDRVRAAIFSMLEARAASMARVLDLYAGTGALGIEALSRGATQADFVEHDARHCALIRENLKATGFHSQAAVHALPVSRAIEVLPGPYDVVFMDPPYADAASLGPMISSLLSRRRLSPGAMLIVEQASRDMLDFTQPGLRPVQQKSYGDTSVSLYVAEGDAS